MSSSLYCYTLLYYCL